MDKFKVATWQPYPGAKGGVELKPKVRPPGDPVEFTKIVRDKDDYTPRRLMIRTDDLGKFGYTAGCPGRRAANRGTTAVGHTEACRKRIVE